jgi:hypothetical protein
MLQAAKKGLITTFGHHANPHTHSRRESSGDLQTGKLHRSFTALPWFSHLQLEATLTQTNDLAVACWQSFFIPFTDLDETGN